MSMPDEVPLTPQDYMVSPPPAYEGKIATNAATADDLVMVTSTEVGDNLHTFGPAAWPYRGQGVLPSRGDPCWFVDADDGSIAILNWTSSTDPPSLATSVELRNHTDLVLGAHGLPSRLSSGQGVLWDGTRWVATTLVRDDDSRFRQYTPTWTTPTFASGWATYAGGGGTWGPVAYFKSPAGEVRLRGLISKATAWTGGETLFTLPAGFRPGINQVSACLANNILERLTILPTGAISTSALSTWTSSLSWIALSDISFWAEA